MCNIIIDQLVWSDIIWMRLEPHYNGLYQLIEYDFPVMVCSLSLDGSNAMQKNVYMTQLGRIGFIPFSD